MVFPETEMFEALRAIGSGAVARDLESATLDFTVQGRSVPDTLKDLAEAAACFANAGGGVIVVGVADDINGPDAFVGCALDSVLAQRRSYELTDPRPAVASQSIERHGAQLAPHLGSIES